MKKTFIILTSLILICIMLIGCNTTDATITTSKELNKNLNLLLNTVNRMDTVDNDYLVSNDLYSLNAINTTVPTPNKAYKNVLAYNPTVTSKEVQNNEIIADEVSLKDDLTNALKNELVNRLYCDSNGNCRLCNNKFTCNDNGVCNSCNNTIICDKDGNCTNCKKQLIIDNNNCANCKTTCVTSTPNANLSTTTKDCLKRISANNSKLDVQLLSLENNDSISDNNNINRDIDNINVDIVNNDKIGDSIITDKKFDTITNTTVKNEEPIKTQEAIINTEKPVVVTDSVIDNENDNNVVIKDSDETDNTIEDTNYQTKPYKIIYYTESTFTPDYLRYNPRFVNQINYDSANENLNKYVEKLQKLYTMTADVVEANNTLANYKVIIVDNIDEAKELNNCILSGECTPSANQVTALNNYIEDIKSTIKNLRNTNGNLSNEINKISNINTGISQSIEITNSNYLRILNQIDTRISYHENAIATLEQIKYLLQDAKNNNKTPVEVEELNNNLNQIISDTKEVDKIAPEHDSKVEEKIITDDADNNVLSEVIDDRIINNDRDFNNEKIIKEEVITETPVKETEVENKIVTEEPVITEVVDDRIDDNTTTNNDTIINDNIIEETTVKDIKNIDTYKDNFNNVNSYLDNKIIGNNNDEIVTNNSNGLTNNNIVRDENINNVNDNIATEDNLNSGVIDNNNVVSDNIPQMVDNSTNNTNTSNNEVLYNNNNFNNSNGYNNTIISQNNLDNNNLGNNSYRYDSNGTLYNNTNGYNSAGINNINEAGNNVNTYKYNTLVDSINRGTVNNGINTLKVTA